MGGFVNTYCVLLCRRPLIGVVRYPRITRFYLSADTADRAVLTASEENPQWRAIGIEPNGFFACPPQTAPSLPTPSISDAA